MVAVLLAVMLVIGVATAAEIKGVNKKKDGQPGSIPITVIAGEDSVDHIDVGGRSLNKESDGITWTGTITQTEEDAGVTIVAKKDNNHIASQPVGNGGCPGKDSYDQHHITYGYAQVNLIQDPINIYNTIFSLHTDPKSDAGVIAICIYPEDGFDPAIGATYKLLYDPAKWEIKHNHQWDYLGFGRHGGNDKNILLISQPDIHFGSVDYKRITNSDNILMHIFDPAECKTGESDDIDGNAQTCWRRPGHGTPIPEFPTVALPIATVIGLVFFFQYRKKKEE